MVTHKQLADRLGTSVAAVATVREIWRGSSAQSQRALVETREEHVLAAAQWLARFRGSPSMAAQITMEVVKGVRDD